MTTVTLQDNYSIKPHQNTTDKITHITDVIKHFMHKE